MLLTSSKS